MSKGEAKQQRASIRQSEEEYCHKFQRGRLLEVLSLMAKMWQRNWHLNVGENNRGRMHLHFELQRAVSVKEQGKAVNRKLSRDNIGRSRPSNRK